MFSFYSINKNKNTMKKTNRTQCVATNTPLKHLHSFKNFPVLLACVDNLDTSTDLKEDMEWGVSKSNLVQLMTLLDPNEIYHNYHTTGVVGNLWKEHHRKFAEFINKDTFSTALEIGGASGKLVEQVFLNNLQSSWTIIEPSIHIKKSDPRVNLIEGYFENYPFKEKFDIIVHSHCIEHAYEPLSFLNKTNELLKVGGVHFISIPNMKYWLENGYMNTLSFEHTCYIDDYVLEFMLNKSGFEVVDKIIEPHSVFLKAIKRDKEVTTSDLDCTYVKDLFLRYTEKVQQDINFIQSQIKENSFYLFGAHTFPQIMLSLGVNASQVICILDNDTNKHNKRLYGTNSMIRSPECLRHLESPIVVVRCGIYSDEIRESIKKINASAILI